MTSGKLPEKYTSLLSEDVRIEINGKLTIVGLYAQGRVGVSAGSADLQLSLSFLFLFEDGEGDFTAKFALEGPDGPVGSPIKAPARTKQPDQALVYSFIFKPTPKLKCGSYVGRLTLEGTKGEGTKTYEQPVLIRDDPNLAPGDVS